MSTPLCVPVPPDVLAAALAAYLIAHQTVGKTRLQDKGEG
jgi:hypothetical protein